MIDKQKIRPISSVVVHSSHPVAFRSITRILASTPYQVTPFCQSGPQAYEENGWILVIDGYSVEGWLETAVQYRAHGARSLIMLSDRPQKEEELRLLYLGVCGIVPISNFEKELAHAVDALTRGQLWFSRNTLNLFATRADSATFKFTIREEQIIALLVQGFCNKKISHLLGISDRTVKFHVSNILHKLKLKNRKSLLKVKLAKSAA